MMKKTPYRPERGPSLASGTPDVLIIADNPSRTDLKNSKCFSGDSALWLARELEMIGIKFHECYAMTAIDFYPPMGRGEKVFKTKTEAKRDHSIVLINGQYVEPRTVANAQRVWKTIDRIKPKTILALGDLSLWMLTGSTSITKHRGSMLELSREWGTSRLLPTYHPNQVMRQLQLKRVFRHDLSRLTQEDWSTPNFKFITYPTFEEAKECLEELISSSTNSKKHYAVDLETRTGTISVCGIAWSATEALVIPFTSIAKPNYWTIEQELSLVKLLRTLLTHPNIEISGQNYHYDHQYFAKLYGIRSNLRYDTMHMAHTLWTKNLPLSLDFLASMFCKWYRFWKDDGKEFHKSITRAEDEKTYFNYNGYDCCYTWEIAEALKPAMQSSDFRAPFQFQQDMFQPLARTMNRGVRFDKPLQVKMRSELALQIQEYDRWFESLPITEWFAKAKGAPWYSSAHKLKQLFYDKFQMEPIRNKSTKKPTTDQNALLVIGKREPVLKPLCDRLIEYSSLCQFQGLYLNAKTDTDSRMRSNYGLAGTDTFRLSSKGDVFGTGMNLQNLSKGD